MHFNLEWKLKPGTIEKNSSSTTGRPGEIKSMAVRHHWATKQACITTINTHKIRFRLSKDPIPAKDLPVDPFFSTVPNLNCNTCMI